MNSWHIELSELRLLGIEILNLWEQELKIIHSYEYGKY